MRVCCGNEFFADFSRFWRCSFSFKMPFQKAIEILDFGFWRQDPVLEQVLARRSFSLANASLLVSAIWRLQTALEWLRHSCSALLLHR